MLDRDPTTEKTEKAIARRPSTWGMTLVELAVTLAVAAILITLAAPSFTSMMAKNRVAGITNELTAALQLARSEAIKRGKRVTVCKSTDPAAATPACDNGNGSNWTAGWLVFVDGNTAGTFDGSGATADELIKIGQTAAHANPIIAGTDFAKFVSYLPDGTSSGTGVEADRTLTLCLAPEERKVIVGRTGQLRMVKGTCP